MKKTIEGYRRISISQKHGQRSGGEWDSLGSRCQHFPSVIWRGINDLSGEVKHGRGLQADYVSVSREWDRGQFHFNFSIPLLLIEKFKIFPFLILFENHYIQSIYHVSAQSSVLIYISENIEVH